MNRWAAKEAAIKANNHPYTLNMSDIDESFAATKNMHRPSSLELEITQYQQVSFTAITPQSIDT